MTCTVVNERLSKRGRTSKRGNTSVEKGTCQYDRVRFCVDPAHDASEKNTVTFPCSFKRGALRWGILEYIWRKPGYLRIQFSPRFFKISSAARSVFQGKIWMDMPLGIVSRTRPHRPPVVDEKACTICIGRACPHSTITNPYFTETLFIIS